MVLVHTLVAEVLAHFINTFKTANNQALQIKLRCDAEIEVNVERVVVCDKRTGACAAGDGLKDWRFNFSVSSIVQHLAQRFDHLGTLQKRLLDTLVDDEVNVALAVAEFRVVKRIVCHAVFFLNDGQRFDAFAKTVSSLAWMEISPVCVRNTKPLMPMKSPKSSSFLKTVL